jgi:hypothetical protein
VPPPGTEMSWGPGPPVAFFPLIRSDRGCPPVTPRKPVEPAIHCGSVPLGKFDRWNPWRRLFLMERKESRGNRTSRPVEFLLENWIVRRAAWMQNAARLAHACTPQKKAGALPFSRSVREDGAFYMLRPRGGTDDRRNGTNFCPESAALHYDSNQ